MMFQQRLKELRSDHHFTQKSLALYLGVSANCICEWEKGRSEPSIETLKKLCVCFECSLDYLIGNSDDFGNVIVAGSSPRDEMTADERTLLADFRTLPDGERAQALAYVEYLAEKRGAKTKKA